MDGESENPRTWPSRFHEPRAAGRTAESAHRSSPPSRAARLVHQFALTAAIANWLADRPALKSPELARALGVPLGEVRAELVALESIGIVYRSGQTRGTRWYLG